MTDDRTNAGGQAATGEPALTQKNSATVRGEEILADSGTAEDLSGETTTRTKTGAMPPSYGAAGGTTDAYEESAGEADSHGSGS
ncbi:MAG: hypothetical protein JWM87_3105 [Candidatus Eremiobacteraeota bacterium]|nr:hypothetical protein [Candidatus Eremiobacteraeota bacterium]